MTVRYEVDGGVATITLASPKTKNVLSAAMLAELPTHFAAAAEDDAVRVIVLTGEGNTFCAGADLSGAAAADAGSFAASGPGALVRVLEAMLDHPKPATGWSRPPTCRWPWRRRSSPSPRCGSGSRPR